MSAKPPSSDPHPGICAGRIGRYVLARLRADSTNFYSAYLLMHEALRLERRCYTQPAWGQSLHVSGLLRIYYDFLTATALGCPAEVAEAAEWFVSDVAFLRQRWAPHFPRGPAFPTDLPFWQTAIFIPSSSDRQPKKLLAPLR